jgi:hypothetical protein
LRHSFITDNDNEQYELETISPAPPPIYAENEFQYETVQTDEDMLGLSTEWMVQRKRRIQEKTLLQMKHIKIDLQTGDPQSQLDAAHKLWEFVRCEDTLRLIDSGAGDEKIGMADLQWTLPKGAPVKFNTGEGDWCTGSVVSVHARDGTYTLNGPKGEVATSVKPQDVLQIRTLRHLPKMWLVLSEAMHIKDSSDESLALATACVSIFWLLWSHKAVDYKAMLIDHNLDVILLGVMENSDIITRCQIQGTRGGGSASKLEYDDNEEGGEEEGGGDAGAAQEEEGEEEEGQVAVMSADDNRSKEEMLTPIVSEFLDTILGLLELISIGPYCRLLISHSMVGVMLSLIEFKLTSAKILHNCIIKLETELGGDETKAQDIIQCYVDHDTNLQTAFFSQSRADDDMSAEQQQQTDAGDGAVAVALHSAKIRLSKDRQYYAMFIFSWLGQRLPMAAHVGSDMDTSTLTKNILGVALDVMRDALVPGKGRDRDSRDILRYCTLCLWEIAEDDVDEELMDSARVMEDAEKEQKQQAREMRRQSLSEFTPSGELNKTAVRATLALKQRAWTVEEYAMVIELAMLCVTSVPDYTSKWWQSNYDLSLFCAAALANMSFNGAHAEQLLEIVDAQYLDGEAPRLAKPQVSDLLDAAMLTAEVAAAKAAEETAAAAAEAGENPTASGTDGAGAGAGAVEGVVGALTQAKLALAEVAEEVARVDKRDVAEFKTAWWEQGEQKIKGQYISTVNFHEIGACCLEMLEGERRDLSKGNYDQSWERVQNMMASTEKFKEAMANYDARYMDDTLVAKLTSIGERLNEKVESSVTIHDAFVKAYVYDQGKDGSDKAGSFFLANRLTMWFRACLKFNRNYAQAKPQLQVEFNRKHLSHYLESREVSAAAEAGSREPAEGGGDASERAAGGESAAAVNAAGGPTEPTKPSPSMASPRKRRNKPLLRRNKPLLPAGMRMKRDKKGNVYYWDSKTGQISWTKPDAVVELEARAENGATGGAGGAGGADGAHPNIRLRDPRRDRWSNLIGAYDQNDDTTDNPLILEAAADMMNCPIPIFRMCAASIVLGLSLKKASRHIVNRHKVYEVVKHVSMHRKTNIVRESKVAAKIQECCSCIIMLLADDYDDEDEEDLNDAVTLVRTAPFSAWQYALSTAWLLARDETNRDRMSQKQIVNLVLQRCESFPLRHHQDYVTLEWVLGVLWIFSFTTTGQEQLLQKRSLAFVLNCCKLPLRFTTAIELGLSVVWTILMQGIGGRSSYARWEGKRLLLDCELLPLLLISINDPGCSTSVATRRLRVLSIQFYQVFAFSPDMSKNAHDLGLADEKRFVKPLLEIIGVSSPYDSAQQAYAANVVVVMSTNPKHFNAMLDCDALGVLLRLSVKRMKERQQDGWEQARNNLTFPEAAQFTPGAEQDSLTSTLHSLLNLSTVPKAQVIIGKSRELKSLVKFARMSVECDAQRFCFGVLQNLKLHAKNRSRLYRFELKYKSVQSCEEEMELMQASRNGALAVRGLTQEMVESWTDQGFDGEDEDNWEDDGDEGDGYVAVDDGDGDDGGDGSDGFNEGEDGGGGGDLNPITPARGAGIVPAQLMPVHVPAPPMTHPRKYLHHQRKLRTPVGNGGSILSAPSVNDPPRTAPTGGTRRQRPLSELGSATVRQSERVALARKGERPESHFHYPLHMLDGNLRSPISDTWGGSRRQKAELMSPMHLDGTHFAGLRVGATQHHYRYRHFHKESAPLSPRYNQGANQLEVETTEARRQSAQDEMRQVLAGGANNQGGEMTQVARRNSQQVMQAVVKRIQSAIQDNKTGHIRFVEDPVCAKNTEMVLKRNEQTGESVHGLATRIGNRIWHPDLVELSENTDGCKVTIGLMELAGARHHFRFHSDSRVGPPPKPAGVVAAAMNESKTAEEKKNSSGGHGKNGKAAASATPGAAGDKELALHDSPRVGGDAVQELHSTARLFGNADNDAGGSTRNRTTDGDPGGGGDFFGGSQPRTEVSKFPHVDGCQYCLGIYGHYKTKDGTMLHLCVKPGMAEAPSIPLNTEAPPVPNTLALLRQDSLPPAPFPPSFRDTNFSYGTPAKADLAPWPNKHTLPVVDHECNWLTCPHFGRVADTSWLKLVCEEYMEAPPEEETPEEEKQLPHWEVAKDSKVWPPRQKTSEARDYFDNKKSEKKAFKMDVEHLFKDERFRNALEKWNKNDPVYKGADLEKMEEALKTKLQPYHSTLKAVYRYYANGGIDWHTMQGNDWNELALDMGLVGQDERLNTAAMGSFYIQGQKIGDAGEKMKTVNSLLRYKFLHILLAFASEKFVNVMSAASSISDALEMLMEQHVIPTFRTAARQLGAEKVLDETMELAQSASNLVSVEAADTEVEKEHGAAEASDTSADSQDAAKGPFDHNVYRRERLYCKEVDDVLHDHFQILSKIFQRYAPPSLAKGSPPQTDGPMIPEEWAALLRDVVWTDENFTNDRQSLVFLWAQMSVSDETKTQKYMTMTYTDFMEAICRTADTRWLPNQSLLEESGCANAIEFMHTRLGENDPTTNQPWGARMRFAEYAAPGMHGPFMYPFKFGYELNSNIPCDQSLSWRLKQTLGLLYTDLQKTGLRGHQLDVLDGQLLRKWTAMLQNGLQKLGMSAPPEDEMPAPGEPAIPHAPPPATYGV